LDTENKSILILRNESGFYGASFFKEQEI